MISAKFAFITTIISILIINTADAISCHRCSSHIDEKCKIIDKSDNSTLEKCPPEKTFCRKTVQHLIEEDVTRITRECGWIKFDGHSEDYCVASDNNFKKERSCQCFTDGCNTGGSFTPLHVLFLSGVIFLVAL